MNLITATGLIAADQLDMELVERKGAGHPDTLADGVAEAISRAYSAYCLQHFGAILHHNTDKTALLGGAAEVTFGHGHVRIPARHVDPARATQTDDILAWEWWTLADLRATGQVVYPVGLTELIDSFLTNGAPASPFAFTG
ncbi:methionine adenosyltransferase [Streptosporangium roseum]|uniref:methionine adenosyltransferase n=1 Tax=Streptosporangium roseum TaxID=2001 RepID=UPI003326C933